MADVGNYPSIPEDNSRLVIIRIERQKIDFDLVLESLRRDQVVLIQKVEPAQADCVLQTVAEKLGLQDSLELQTGLAGFLGHRHNIGRFFMSVNKRSSFQFVTPHSEGSSFLGMQLSAFFCYENTTDGGETILLNVDDSGLAWELVRERVVRAKLGSRPLARHEIIRARGLYQLNIPADVLRDDDRILGEQESKIPGLTVLDVLARPAKTYSRLLDRKLNVYWDSVDSSDHDSVKEYANLLRSSGLLKVPPGIFDLHRLDSDAERRVWHSGVVYKQLFRCKITYKLAPGDLIIQNNLTWTHAASNWSPNSGVRKIAASFA
jgi:hypothetical protein